MAARTGAGEWRWVPISADNGYLDPLKNELVRSELSVPITGFEVPTL